jgi:hypothetical protein
MERFASGKRPDHCGEERNVKFKLLAVTAAFGTFVLAGPLQHVGVLPKTMVGDASKATLKAALNFSSTPAFASCGGGSNSASRPKGNNGWGNGEDPAPGNSLANQPKFEDPNTGPTPCHGPACSDGDR